MRNVLALNSLIDNLTPLITMIITKLQAASAGLSPEPHRPQFQRLPIPADVVDVQTLWPWLSLKKLCMVRLSELVRQTNECKLLNLIQKCKDSFFIVHLDSQQLKTNPLCFLAIALPGIGVYTHTQAQTHTQNTLFDSINYIS